MKYKIYKKAVVTLSEVKCPSYVYPAKMMGATYIVRCTFKKNTPNCGYQVIYSDGLYLETIYIFRLLFMLLLQKQTLMEGL